MKRSVLLVLILLSLSLYSQEDIYRSKIDSLNSLKEKNIEQIAILNSMNTELNREINTLSLKLDSINIEKNKNSLLRTTIYTAFYRDLNMTDRLEDIPKNATVILLDVLEDNIHISYGNVEGYAKPHNFESNDEKINLNLKHNTTQRVLTEKEKRELEKRDRIVERFGSRFGYLIASGKYAIGMTPEMVRASLGSPNDVNRTVGSWGVHEQWVYDKKDLYIYFENGKVTSFQD